MSEIAEIFGSVEIRIEKLLKKLNSLEDNVAHQQSELDKNTALIKKQDDEIEALKKEYNQEYVGAQDPGVISVTKIYNHYKKHSYSVIFHEG